MKAYKTFTLNNASLTLLALMTVFSLFVPWHRNPVPSFHSEWLVIMLGLLAGILALPVLWRQQVLQIPRLVLYPLLLIVFIAIQAQVLPLVVAQHAQMAMLYLLWAALLMILVRLLATQTNRQQVADWLAAGLVTAAVCATLLELYFRFKGLPEQWGGTAQYNNFADLLVLGLVSTWYLTVTDFFKQRGYMLIPALVILVGLSLTPSRSVWLYWVAGLIILKLLNRHTLKWLVISFGLYLLLQTLWTVDFSFSTPNQATSSAAIQNVQPPATAIESFHQKTAGTSTRLHIWKVAWQLFCQSPLLGQGFGQFDFAYFQAGQYLPEQLPWRIEHAHNLILHLLAELGLVPVVLLLILLGGWLKNVIVDIAEIQHSHDNKASAFYAWLLMLLAVLGLHSLLEYPLWYAQFLGIAALLLALGETQPWQIRLILPVKIAVSLLLSAGIGIAAIHEWQYIKLENALAEYNRSKNMQVFASLGETARQAPLLIPYVTVVLSFDADLSNQNLRGDLTALNDASYHFWPAANFAYRQAELQALNELTNEAQQTMRLALLAYPDPAKDFIKKLSFLNTNDQKKTEFLKKMVLDRGLHSN